MDPLLYLLLGIALGGVIGWLLGARFRGERQETPLASVNLLEAELRQQLTYRDGELTRTRSQLAEASAGLAATEARRGAADKQVEEVRTTLRVREAELSDTALKLTQTGHQLAATQAQLAGASKLLAEQHELHERQLREAKATQDKALADLREAFKALSADALKQTQPEFLRLANETLGKFAESAKGDLSQRQEAIATLVKPLEEQLKTYQARLAQSETTQSTALGEVKKHLESLAEQNLTLSTATQKLRLVLSSNQARGRWGEETLRRVVEAAGMSAHCDFTEQAQSEDKKPDLIVRLPGDRLIIVDAKVPDLNFLSALGTADETRRAESLAAHADKLRSTIKALADRDYPAQFPNALDHVVLFLPAESLFSAALEGDHGLILWAAERRIMIATPASLIALLRSVSVSWQQHEQTVNAKQIAESAGELFSRVATFARHFENIGAGLERAGKAYNDAVGSYESRVRPQGEAVLKLGAASGGKELPELAVVAGALRPPPVVASESTGTAQP